jgi:hypothetical protein
MLARPFPCLEQGPLLTLAMTILMGTMRPMTVRPATKAYDTSR